MNGGIIVSTGIVRRIDELGRIVIPKEIRKSLRIKTGDNLEIILEDEKIILKKYSQIETVTDTVDTYVESFYQVLKYNVIVTDTDKVIAAAGNLSKKYLNCEISDNLTNMIERRDSIISGKRTNIEIISGITQECYYAMSTIINNGDSIGAVIIFSTETPMLEQEEKLAMILANIISNNFV